MMDNKKTVKRGRDLFYKYNRIINLFVSYYNKIPVSKRIMKLEKHRFTRGKIGYGIRYALVKSLTIKCGDNVSIAPGVYLFNINHLSLGSNISIHPMCYIECGTEEGINITIDDNVSIAHGTTIIATSHTYQNNDTDVIKDMPVVSKPVHICSNVWIGAKSTILYGTTIQSGCVIGANSVVNKSTKANGIYVGTPAIRIKERL